MFKHRDERRVNGDRRKNTEDRRSGPTIPRSEGEERRTNTNDKPRRKGPRRSLDGRGCGANITDAERTAHFFGWDRPID